MTHRRTAGFTLIELLLVMAILGIVVAIAMAGYRNARVRGNETSAVATLTTINHAQAAFAQACGNGHFAPTFAALVTPMPTTGHGFLSPDLTGEDKVSKSGYQFVMAGTAALDVKPSCTGATPVSSYRVSADPLVPGSGLRFFGTNGDRVVYHDTVTFAADMPETGAPPHGAEIK
jgi:prepilin-type N-terminal cleavage/methylation domain-containing protein